MRQAYRIEMDDGSTYEVVSDARDIRAWEAAYEKSYFATPVSYTELAQVAYLAAKRTGVLNGQYKTYADFDAHCIDARGAATEDPARLVADPTQPVATGDSSAPSPTGSNVSRRNSKPKARRS